MRDSIGDAAPFHETVGPDVNRTPPTVRSAPRPPARKYIRFCYSILSAFLVLSGCHARAGLPPTPTQLSIRETAFLDTLEERTFQYFWELSDSKTGLTPDRWPTQSFISVGATGFALTAYPIGAERGYVTREAAAERVLTTLRFLWDGSPGLDSSRAGAPANGDSSITSSSRRRGHRFRDVELSTMDTALLLAGALFCQSLFRSARTR